MIATVATLVLLAAPADPPTADAHPAPAVTGGAPQAHAAAGLAGASLDDLAKQLQNPLANLVSVPFQNNFNGAASGNSASYNLNFQPVIPVELDDDWNLIVRPIVPYYSVPLPSGDQSTGLGEIMLETFLSPAKATKFIWGVGPVVSFPTATNGAVATGCFAAGPVVALVYMDGPWVLGTLITQLDAFACAGTTRLDTTSAQVFVNYNLPNAWAIGTVPTFVANWNLSGEKWLVPVGATVSKTLSIAKLPISLSLGFYTNVVKPEGGSPWLTRMVVTFMFPK